MPVVMALSIRMVRNSRQSKPLRNSRNTSPPPAPMPAASVGVKMPP